MRDWTLLTNHAQVLLCVAADPEVRLRDIADAVGVAERAAHRIVSDLVEGGYLTKRRVGRRNRYEVNPDAPLRRAAYRDHTVGELIQLLMPRSEVPSPAAPRGTGLRNTSEAGFAKNPSRRRVTHSTRTSLA